MQAMRSHAITEVLTNDRHFEQEGFRALLRDSRSRQGKETARGGCTGKVASTPGCPSPQSRRRRRSVRFIIAVWYGEGRWVVQL